MALPHRLQWNCLGACSIVWAVVLLWAGASSGRIDGTEDPFIVLDPSFEKIIGPNPQLFLIGEKAQGCGEGPVYDPTSDTFMFTGTVRKEREG